MDFRVAFRRSIFIKLFLVLLATGFLIHVVVVSVYRTVYKPKSRTAFYKNFDHYAGYLIKELGEPPDSSIARALSQKLLIDIRFEGAGGAAWSTSRDLTKIAEIRHYCRRFADRGWYHGRFFVIVPAPSGQFLFATGFGNVGEFHEELLILLLALLTLILFLSFLALRRILSPLKLLMKGVSEVSAGRLDTRLPVQRHDELGALADAFNTMTQKIREMIAARDRLLLDVSHELRSPLTRMRVALEFLPEDKIRQGLSEDIQGMEKMVEEILETERLQSEHGKLKREAVDLVPLLRRTGSAFEKWPPGIVWKEGPASAGISADPSRLAILFKNLFDNAFKYSAGQPRPVEVTISVGAGEASVVIRDHGPGIPAAHLPFVFEPFYRVDPSRSRETGGFGLGLSLCKRIVEAQGGSIAITSEKGEGTRVVVAFPSGTVISR